MLWLGPTLTAEVSFGGARIGASISLEELKDWVSGFRQDVQKLRDQDKSVRILLECPDCSAGSNFLTTRRIDGMPQQCCRRCRGRFPVEGL